MPHILRTTSLNKEWALTLLDSAAEVRTVHWNLQVFLVAIATNEFVQMETPDQGVFILNI